MLIFGPVMRFWGVSISKSGLVSSRSFKLESTVPRSLGGLGVRARLDA